MKKANNDQKILKEYLANLRMDQARTKFKVKTKMLKNIKKHFKNDPKDIKKLCQCSECEHIYSREHVIWCDWYKNLRENKDLSNCVDLTCYFQQFLCLPRNYRG